MKSALERRFGRIVTRVILFVMTGILGTFTAAMIYDPIKDAIKSLMFSPLMLLLKPENYSTLLAKSGETVESVPFIASVSANALIWVVIIIVLFLCIVTSMLSRRRLRNCQVACQLNTQTCSKLEEITESSDTINGAIIYKYNTHVTKTEGIIEVEHVCSVAEKDACLNAIIRERFCLPKETYFQIKDFASLYNSYLSKRTSLGSVKARGRGMLEHIKPRLIKSEDDITENDCCLYQIYRMIWLIVNDEKSVGNVLGEDYAALESALLNSKRTGILASVFLNDIQIFQNTKRFKNNRAYISFKFEIQGRRKNLIFLIAADGEALGANSDVEDIANIAKEKFTSSTPEKLDNTQDLGA